MKAMMSGKLRSILNDPKLARELQKRLTQSSVISNEKDEKREASASFKSAITHPTNQNKK